jgi:ATP-binding cassette subfamily C protein CydD
MAAAERAFAVLDRVPAESGVAASSSSAVTGPITVTVRGLTLAGRDGLAPDGLDATMRPGRLTVLTGPNGSGKSTALHAIVGLLPPEAGTVLVNGVPLDELDPERWWARVGWLPQRPVLVPGSLADNVALLGARVGSEELGRACAATGFDAVLAELPDGWDTVVGVGGAGLSLGQRQRLALARVLAADRALLLLDEPTAHLDPESEAAVLGSLIQRARAGATVVVVGHRAPVLAAADDVVEVRSSVRA